MTLKEAMGTSLNANFLRREMMLTHMTFKNRLDSWLLIAKATTISGEKRIAFTSGKTPASCMLAFEKAFTSRKLSWKDDTPYQPPIDKAK